MRALPGHSSSLLPCRVAGPTALRGSVVEDLMTVTSSAVLATRQVRHTGSHLRSLLVGFGTTLRPARSSSNTLVY